MDALEDIGTAAARNILGVNAGADSAAIKAAYRRKIIATHPDKLMAQGASPEEIEAATLQAARINKAYEVLESAHPNSLDVTDQLWSAVSEALGEYGKLMQGMARSQACVLATVAQACPLLKCNPLFTLWQQVMVLAGEEMPPHKSASR